MPAQDVALILASGETIVADGNSDYIECEGGFLAWVHMFYGTMAGGTSMDTRVMVSIDAGANYFKKGQFQQVVPTDDDKEDRIPVYIPQAATAGVKVRVRLNYDVTGAISVAITNCLLEPMTSLSVPAIDEQLQIGAASLISAL